MNALSNYRIAFIFGVTFQNFLVGKTRMDIVKMPPKAPIKKAFQTIPQGENLLVILFSFRPQIVNRKNTFAFCCVRHAYLLSDAGIWTQFATGAQTHQKVINKKCSCKASQSLTAVRYNWSLDGREAGRRESERVPLWTRSTWAICLAWCRHASKSNGFVLWCSDSNGLSAHFVKQFVQKWPHVIKVKKLLQF